MATTIRDVAHRAGVSTATVSRALRDATSVTAETRARVTQAAADLEYVPSQLGRQLAQGRHAANGIVFPDLSGPYYAEVVLGYESVAAQLDRSVLILSTHGRRDADVLVAGLAARCDGLVVLGPTVDDEVVHRLNRRGTPIVLVARSPLSDVDSVNAENNASGTLLGEHLVAAGARTIVFVGDPEATSDVTERFAAVKAAAERDGASVTVDPVSDFSEEAGVHAARQALSTRRTTRSLPDAFACANDELALGMLLALRDAGLRVPEDVALVGLDDIEEGRWVRPALTTVAPDTARIATRALDLLADRIDALSTPASARSGLPPRREVVPHRLVERGSTDRAAALRRS